jgi:hypothetical protein
LKREPSLLLDSKSAGRIGYKTQSKFVRRNHPSGDDARFRKGLPTLEDILRVLKERAGENTFTKLVGLGVIREEIGSLLQMIGVSSDDPIQWPREKRREAEQLSRNCIELAATIELARQKWPFGSRMMYSDYEEWNELPRVLRSYAQAWKKQLKYWYRSARSPRNENIVGLLEYVKSKTGDYHYEDVATLLNATDATYGWEWSDGIDHWDAKNLKQIISRKKKKLKK